MPFSEERVRLGLDISLSRLPKKQGEPDQDDKDERDEVVEMRNSVGLWERRSGQSKCKLGSCFGFVQRGVGKPSGATHARESENWEVHVGFPKRKVLWAETFTGHVSGGRTGQAAQNHFD